jgi:hypothetical protein
VYDPEGVLFQAVKRALRQIVRVASAALSLRSKHGRGSAPNLSFSLKE